MMAISNMAKASKTASTILTKCRQSGSTLLFGLEVPPSLHIYSKKQPSLTPIVLGVDEVARGCLAGPVVAGCVSLNIDNILDQACKNPDKVPRIADSKKFS